MFRSVISGCGSYLPKRVMTNADLEKMVDTSDEWILQRTGISKRYIASDGEMVSDMAKIAAERAINNSGIDISEIDAIILATTSPDMTFPSTATIVQAKLGIKNAFAFDVQAVCSGFVYAVDMADSLIKTGKAKNILVIGADILSRIVNWQDRGTCIVFGDGAGAVVLSAKNHGESDILASKLYSDGEFLSILKTTSGPSGYIEMNGQEVFRHAVEKMSCVVDEILNKAGFEIDDLNWLVPHQANTRILDSVGKRLGIPMEKVIETVSLHANTSAASIPLALDVAINQRGQIRRGDLLAICAIGGGLTWGGILLRY